ncbi:Lamin-C [Trichinella patagoniensis]|uniref:Lamin-C n=1 Tax=Trichinella patagoniensis TaxID=990121 RepID=A0A0V0ZJC8_9BILA|nr:Lamin-C [Trichinella patagoniensis]
MSRSVRRTTQMSYIQSESSSSPNTPGVRTTSAEQISSESPLTPTCQSRLQEKHQLQHLNDRLAQYIERVRQLEAENQRLSLSIRNTEDIVSKERNSLRDTYERELAEARRLLDECSKAKARAFLELNKNMTYMDELQTKVERLERHLQECEERRAQLDGQVQDLTTRLNASEAQRKHWENEAKKLCEECDSLTSQLANVQKKHDAEALTRVDLENKVQSLREQLAFNKQLYEKEIEETRHRRQIEITEINHELEEDYKQKLQEALQLMREQLDEKIKISRKEIEDMYDSKMQTLRESAERNRDSANTAREELGRANSQLSYFETERAKYEEMVRFVVLLIAVANLEKKNRELESRYTRLHDEMYARLSSRDTEIRQLRDEIALMIQQYKDLMDIKVQLSVEIEAYRRLLEGEEKRLHLSPTPPPPGSESPAVRPKKRRILHERETEVYATYETNSECIGDIEIIDHDVDGLFVKLNNKSSKDLSLNGWSVVRAGTDREVTYKFHPKLVMKPGKQLTIWSANAGVQHNPPSDLVMKNQHWPVGNRIRTSVVNPQDEEVAWRESVKSSRSERTTFRTGDPFDYGLEGTDQRCSVM